MTQIVLGGFMAGMRAGLIHNVWPVVLDLEGFCSAFSMMLRIGQIMKPISQLKRGCRQAIDRRLFFLFLCLYTWPSVIFNDHSLSVKALTLYS